MKSLSAGHPDCKKTSPRSRMNQLSTMTKWYLTSGEPERPQAWPDWGDARPQKKRAFLEDGRRGFETGTSISFAAENWYSSSWLCARERRVCECVMLPERLSKCQVYLRPFSSCALHSTYHDPLLYLVHYVTAAWGAWITLLNVEKNNRRSEALIHPWQQKRLECSWRLNWPTITS